MIRLAAEDDDSSRLLIAYLASALTHLYLGDLVVASAEFEQGIVLYRPGDWPNELYASEPRCICHSYLARTQWILGEVDRALESSHESLSIARSLEDRAAQMQALGMHTLLLVLRRDNEEARHYAAETIEHATRYGFVYWQVLGAMFQSWLVAQEGRTQEGIAQFSRCLDLYQGQGAKLGVSWFFAGLAEMKGRNGQVEESLTLLSEALAHVEETDERYYEAEIHRLQGEMMLLRGGPGSQEDAEACFGRALRVSRAQEAGSWELRASISQARLCRDQGRLEEARKLIEPFAAIAGRTGPSPDHRDALHLLECLGTA
jgi:predicted ATPase